MKWTGSKNNYTLLIALLSAMLFIPFLGSVHLFDWDEINFAECAREMIVSGNYSSVQINFQPFWEKPPLFIWMQVLSMKIFGINEFAARFPNAVCGIVTLIFIFRTGSKLIDLRFGLVWVLSFAGSILPFFYFKSGIIDPWFNLFIFAAVYQVILHSNHTEEKYETKTALLSGVLIGLATLTKGPVALLIFILCGATYYAISKFRKVFSFKWIFLFLVSFLITSGSWFFYIWISGNEQLIYDFVNYQVRLFSTKDSGHGGFFGYHFVVLLLGCFPASIFAIRGLKKNKDESPYVNHFKQWMKILFWVVIILFSIVKTKIVHYSSLCYFPLTFLSAYTIYRMVNKDWEWKKWMTVLFLSIGIILSFIFSLLPLIDSVKSYFLHGQFINDRFAADSFTLNANWLGWEWIPGVFFMFFLILFFYKLKSFSMKSAVILFSVVTLFIFFITTCIVPQVETYTQRPQIEFYKSLRKKKCYVETVHFKSYANLFYTEKTPDLNTPELLKHVREKIESDIRTNQEVFSFNLYATNFIRGEKIQFPAYFVVKTDHIAEFKRECPHIHEIYRKGGYVFLFRPVPKIK